MIVRKYDDATVITPTSHRGMLYGVLNCGVTEIPQKDISLKDLSDVELSNLDSEDTLLYNEETEKWENISLEKPVSENVDKYLKGSSIDGGGVPGIS